MPILFLDTESHPETKEIQTIQTRYEGKTEIYTLHDNREALWRCWINAGAVVMYNAPYDMGVLSTLPECSFESRQEKRYDEIENRPVRAKSYWRFTYPHMRYDVHYISGFRNWIRPLRSLEDKGRHGKNPTPPVIDLLKLWSILIEEKNIGLKALLKREFGWSVLEEGANIEKSREYAEQDVIGLEKLWYRFIEKVDDVEDVRGYTLKEWSDVKTVATLCKRARKLRYPQIREYRKHIEKENRQTRSSLRKCNMKTALDRAYRGGITIALHRGEVSNTAWYDISGAYSHAIQFRNTDQYIDYTWSKSENTLGERPRLHLCYTDTYFRKVNLSLKIFRTKQIERDIRSSEWFWSDDIIAMQNLFPDMQYEIIESYEPIPLRTDILQSQAAYWSDKKDEEKAKNGKTTRYKYFKDMSNTSYGITAERTYPNTLNTNLVIAGIITSAIHRVLTTMVKTARDEGCRWLYSDTDSICIELPQKGRNAEEIELLLNEAISPYSCELEYVGNTRIFSLKRYITSKSPRKDPDKIKLHGISQYAITPEKLKKMIAKPDKVSTRRVKIAGIKAATAVGYKRIMNIYGKTIKNPHPFMFVKDVGSDITYREWFMDWYRHIDTKATFTEGVSADDEYPRDIPVFEKMQDAVDFYEGYTGEEDLTEDALIECAFLDPW